MSSAISAAASALRDALCHFDPAALIPSACADLAVELATTEKACAAARLLAAVRAAEAGAHKHQGFNDPAAWLARQGGTTTSRARQELECAKGLGSCPDTKDALLAGEVSLAQAQEITKTEADTPGHERTLLETARGGDLSAVREEARDLRLGSIDPADLHRAQLRARSFRHFKDRLGMVRFDGALPPETGVPFVNRIELAAQRARRAAKADANAAGAAQKGAVERFEAYAADALASLVAGSTDTDTDADSGTDPDAGTDPGAGTDSGTDTGSRSGSRSGSGSGAGVRADLVIVCDLFAWRRGHAHPGEPCHIVEGGPIPVDLAHELAQDAFLKVVLHDGVAIHTVSHVGRRYTAELRSALDLGPVPAFTGRRCVDCGRRYGLQYDHVDPVAHDGPTSYSNIAPRCFLDHKEKTERDRRAGLLRRPPAAPRAAPARPPDPPT